MFCWVSLVDSYLDLGFIEDGLGCRGGELEGFLFVCMW